MAPPRTYDEWENAVKETKEQLRRTPQYNSSNCGCSDYTPCTHRSTMTYNHQYSSIEMKLRELMTMQKSYCPSTKCAMYLEPSWICCPHCAAPSHPSERANPHSKCNLDYKKAFCGDCGKPVINIYISFFITHTQYIKQNV